MATFTGTTNNDTADATANNGAGSLNGFTGGTLADLIDGLGDMFVASSGDDTIVAGSGNDTLNGGLGADSLNGGSGFDVATYVDAGQGLTARLDTPGLNTFGATGDSYLSIEGLIGTSFSDTLAGNTSSNLLDGGNGTGNDTLLGGDGNDILIGGLGADSLDGGNGIDTASYANASVGLIANLASPALNTQGATGDTYVSIESLYGSAFADELVGNAGDNTLDGGINASNDTLIGGNGNDTLIGGLGADSLDGGDGFDMASYTFAGNPLIINLASPELNTHGAAGDTYLSIEGLIGSSLSDQLTGNAGDNRLVGGSGNDTLDGGAGSDSINGGEGDDTIVWDAGDSLANVLGDNGTDTLRVLNQAAPNTFDLTAHQFERALVVTDDPGGNWWQQISDTYNASWQRTNSETRADNGDVVQTTYDVSPSGTGVNWQYISDYRSAANVLTNQDGLFDNGGTFAKSYDYAAGTGTDGISDELSQFTYFFRNITDQQQSKVLNVEGFYDDGRKFTQTNDIDSAYAWQFQTNWYETDGVTLDFLEIRWDDGSTQIIPY